MKREKIQDIALAVIMEEQANCMKDANEKEVFYLMAFNDGVIEVTNRLIESLVKKNAIEADKESEEQ